MRSLTTTLLLALALCGLASHGGVHASHMAVRHEAGHEQARRGLLSDIVAAMRPTSWQDLHDNQRWNCLPDRGHEFREHKRLNDTAHALIYNIAARNWTAVEALFAVDVESRFVLSSGTDTGAFHGRNATMAYLYVIDPHQGEMVDFHTTFRVIWDAASVTTMSVMWLIYWPVLAIQDNFETALHETLYIETDCFGEVTVYAAWVDTGDAQRANLPPAGETNLTRLCAGGPSRVYPGEWSKGIQDSCVGVNQQYASVAACVAYMQALPYQVISPNEATGNSTSCRSWHLGMARRAPELHCMHVGPTGGGKCCTGCTPDSV